MPVRSKEALVVQERLLYGVPVKGGSFNQGVDQDLKSDKRELVKRQWFRYGTTRIPARPKTFS